VFDFQQSFHRRRPSLTPIIDVVFLLLVFFMLASTFTVDRQVNLLSETIYGMSQYDEHPRLIEIKNDKLLINGIEADDTVAIKRLEEITLDLSQIIIVQVLGGTSTQRMLDVIELLKSSGFSNLKVSGK
jgi:biopolymer transport protein ExbD